MTSEFLKKRLTRIDLFLQENYIDTGKIPGAQILIAKNGKIEHFSNLGLIDVAKDKPIEKDSIFRIASMTKPITSVALMMLYEQGKFQLNEPISNFIPEWSEPRVYDNGNYPNIETKPAKREITFRDLLSHQAGLSYGRDQSDPVDLLYQREIKPEYLGPFRSVASSLFSSKNKDRNIEYKPNLSDFSKKLSEFPLLYSPGERWNYSYSTDLCGYLVEVISGKRFEKYLSENIFGPLEMKDTSFSVLGEKITRFASSYRADISNKFLLWEDSEKSNFTQEQYICLGGAGLVSTSLDYFNFSQMLLDGGKFKKERLLSRKTVEFMTSNHLSKGQFLSDMALSGKWTETTFDGVGFGLGFSVVMDTISHQVPGSNGTYAWGGALNTAFWVDPIEKIVVVFMTQLYPSDKYPIRRELQILVNSALNI
ncbi:MAG: serine hydrolase [Chloroflexi bacterium]|nr:serine hydrolase [Chloroflexota bacterium]